MQRGGAHWRAAPTLLFDVHGPAMALTMHEA